LKIARRFFLGNQVKPGHLWVAFNKAEKSEKGAFRVRFLSACTSFLQAHTRSQRELVKHFGADGCVHSSEEARCLLDSQTEVYVAIVMACNMAKLVDAAALEALFVLKESNHIAGELSKIVHSAHDSGVLGVRETESLLHPMKEHIAGINRQLNWTLQGRLQKLERRTSNTKGIGRPSALSGLSGGPTATPSEGTASFASSRASACGEEPPGYVGWAQEPPRSSSAWASKATGRDEELELMRAALATRDAQIFELQRQLAQRSHGDEPSESTSGWVSGEPPAPQAPPAPPSPPPSLPASLPSSLPQSPRHPANATSAVRRQAASPRARAPSFDEAW